MVGKRVNAGDQHLLLFLQCFLLYQGKFSQFEPYRNCCLQVLDQAKIWPSSEWFTYSYQIVSHQTKQLYSKHFYRMRVGVGEGWGWRGGGWRRRRVLENIVQRVEIARNENFLCHTVLKILVCCGLLSISVLFFCI